MFTDEMKAELGKMLSPDKVKYREGHKGKDGKISQLAYIEGFTSIQEANRIFGFDGWSRRIINMTPHVTGEFVNAYGKKQFKVAYTCTIEITAHGVTRCGVGFGDATGSCPVSIHELAIKEAETDATKRALMTFGNPLGLALYDKTREFVGYDTSETDALRSELASLIANAPEATQKWFTDTHKSAQSVHEQNLLPLINKIKETIKKASEQAAS